MTSIKGESYEVKGFASMVFTDTRFHNPTLESDLMIVRWTEEISMFLYFYTVYRLTVHSKDTIFFVQHVLGIILESSKHVLIVKKTP